MASERPPCRVSSCFVGLIGYVFWLRRIAARKQPGVDEVRGRIDQLIEEGARQMRACGLDPRDYDDARFAVCAWIDETILNMPWQHREEWTRHLLQVRYYNTTNAGEEFFERLNRLRIDEEQVREVYYLCLSLGFRGRYHQPGDEFLLEQLRRSNLKSLVGTVKELGAYAEERLFDGAYHTERETGVAAPRPRFWTAPRALAVAVPPALAGLLFLIYYFVLGGVTEGVISRVIGG